MKAYFMGYLRLLLLVGLTFLLSTFTNVEAADQSDKKKSDVRLLIDISGSMKKNDPNNLRVPALQLVTNLLPKGADAGVWAFGRYVNMMVPLSTVDSKWQLNATNTAKKINSKGLFTNIGSVLQKASYGWTNPDPSEKRSMVLLTDGMVDVSKDPAFNAKERARILNSILPKLKKAGVAIHTIALSDNADHELLKELSKQTDGWYEAVNNAEELQKVFLKIFEQAAARDNLPITDNQFKVDSSIDEMTVLIFRKNAASPAKLVSPSGLELDKNSADSNIRWFSTESYDLVTLQKPETGQWQIDADVDPDNRVMVVSKLGLSVSEVPNNLLAGEAIDYQLKMLEDGQVITNPDFLQLVDARLEQNKAGQKNRMAMFYDASNHSFKQNFFTDNFEGELQLKLFVKSPTFERVRTHSINIYGSPLIVDVEQSPDNVIPHKIHFTVRDDIVEPDSLKVSAVISMPDDEKIFLGIEKIDIPMDISPSLVGGDYSIEFKIAGLSVLAREFEVTPAATEFSTNSSVVDVIKEPVAEETGPAQVEKKSQAPLTPEPETKITQEKENKTPEPSPIKEKAGEQDGINWLYWGLGINLLLVVVGFIGWRIIKKRNSAGVSALADELGIDDEDDEDDDEG